MSTLRTTSALAALLLLLCSLWPAPATAQPPSWAPSADARPYVPRYQGPYEPEPQGQYTLGLSLMGAGAVSGGVGLLLLETSHEDSANVPLGTGLLVSGVFLGGFGFYTLISTSLPSRTVITDRATEPPAWSVGVLPTQGGAMLGSAHRF